MSELDDFMAEGMQIAEEVVGTETFVLQGRPYVGILNEYEGSQEIEIAGVLSHYNATLVCQRPQFRRLGSPLHKVLKGKVVEMDGVKYTIDNVKNDSSSVTLYLLITR